MAVPKRRMSRSNTRSRRAQWKAAAPTLVRLLEPRLPRDEAAARGLPDLRHLRRPPGRQPGLILDAGSGRWPSAAPQGPVDGPRRRCSRALGVELDDELLTLALTHRSYAYENGGLPTNERLEFLGDSVLGIVVTERLYRDHPDLPEGQLAKLRASVVNMHALAGVAAGSRRGRRARVRTCTSAAARS